MLIVDTGKIILDFSMWCPFKFQRLSFFGCNSKMFILTWYVITVPSCFCIYLYSKDWKMETYNYFQFLFVLSQSIYLNTDMRRNPKLFSVKGSARWQLEKSSPPSAWCDHNKSRRGGGRVLAPFLIDVKIHHRDAMPKPVLQHVSLLGPHLRLKIKAQNIRT